MKTIINKNNFFALLFTCFSTVFYAQTVFDKYDGQDDVTSVIVNKKMFDLISKVKADTSNKEEQQYLNLITKLDNLKVFTTKNAKIESDMKLTADKYIKSAALEELMRVNDSERNVKIYVKSGTKDTQIKELFMFIDDVKNEETVLLSLTGNFNLNEISVLTDKMRLPGGADLKKAFKLKN